MTADTTEETPGPVVSRSGPGEPGPNLMPRDEGAHASHAVWLDRVGAGYDGNPVVSNVSLALPEGGSALLLGPNGGGKSTLCRVLVGLLPALSGEAVVLGALPAQVRQHVAFVSQRTQLSTGMPVTVTDIVAAGRLAVRGSPQRLRRVDRVRVSEALERVGIGELGSRRAGELSVGQLRRAMLARALAADARVLVLDEPLAGLDREASDSLVALLAGLPPHVAIVAASHQHERFAPLDPVVVSIDGLDAG
jgi:ABC-type Mn2+/Zn2+ transport system ATPase subunit